MPERVSGQIIGSAQRSIRLQLHPERRNYRAAAEQRDELGRL